MSWSASSPLDAVVTSCPSSLRTDERRSRIAGSSSTTRMLLLGLAIRRSLHRKRHQDGRALLTRPLDAYRSTMRCGDLRTDCQPEPGPLRPRRVERLEDPGKIRL